MINGFEINRKEQKLLVELVDNEIHPKFSLRNAPKKEKQSLEKDIEKLSVKLKTAGVNINYNPQSEEYWINYADFHKDRELRPLATPEKKDTVLLYLSPGKYGLGTKMFGPLVAEGLNLFLNHNKPKLNGADFSNKPLMAALDAIIINGGYMPEIPRERTRSIKELDKIDVLDQLSEQEMSPERLERERKVLSELKKQNWSKEKIDDYMKNVYGKISTFDEAVVKVSNLLKTMFNGFKGQLICNTGNEFEENKKVYKFSLEEEITEHLKEINAFRREINSFSKQIKNYKHKGIIASNLIDVIDKLHKFIADDAVGEYDDFKSYYADLNPQSEILRRKKDQIRKSKNVIDWIDQNPRESERRKVFKNSLNKYVEAKVLELSSGEFDWTSKHFKGMTAKEIKEHKLKYDGVMANKAISALEIIRTYYGLGWQSKLNKKRKYDAGGNIDLAQKETVEKKLFIDSKKEILYALGWFDDSPISKSHILDQLRLTNRAEEELIEIYEQAANGFKARILSDGNYSKIEINGFAINTKNHEKAEIPKGKTLFDLIRKEILQRVQDDEPVFDITLTGAGDRGIIEAYRDTNSSYRDAPKLKYQDDARPLLSIQTPHLYTSEIIKESEKKISMKDYKAGHVFIHVMGKSGTEHRIDAICVDDLMNIAILKKNLDKKLLRIKDKEERKKAIQKFEKSIEYETITHVVNLGDLHFGDRNSIHMNTSEMRRNGSIDYMEQNWSKPSVLIVGEAFDGYQFVKGMDLAHQSKAMTKAMHDAAIENIRLDEDLTYKRRIELIEELGRMQTDGFAKTPMEVQKQEFIKSSTAKYVLETIRNNADVILLDGDHPSRTTHGKSSESLSIKNMFELAEIVNPDGKTIKAADKMNVGDLSQITNTVRYNGDASENPNNHGINIYTTHKGGENELDALKNMGGAYDTMQSQHNHHLRAQVKGKQSSLVPPGKVQPYDIVDQKGVPSNLEGVARTLFADRINSNYKKSVSFEMAFESAIENEEFKHRKELRRELVEKYVPAR